MARLWFEKVTKWGEILMCFHLQKLNRYFLCNANFIWKKFRSVKFNWESFGKCLTMWIIIQKNLKCVVLWSENDDILQCLYWCKISRKVKRAVFFQKKINGLNFIMNVFEVVKFLKFCNLKVFWWFMIWKRGKLRWNLIVLIYL